nr:PREDICTED: ATPase family AAA domain-containing protein 2-like [Opisthocomus hoazin]
MVPMELTLAAGLPTAKWYHRQLGAGLVVLPAGAGVSSEKSEEKDDDGEDTGKCYYFRWRKAVERYQAPLEEPRQRKTFSSSRSSPVRQRASFTSAQSQGSCRRNTGRRRHAVHNSDSTSSSSSDDEEHFERRRKRSRSRALRRCLPLNFGEEELKGIHQDQMEIGASLADVDPMKIDCSVRFDGVGGLSDHISSLKETVVFPLLYPEVFERFKIQPPRRFLFHGPPGTGKTLVARALANECSQGARRIAFFMRNGADYLSEWVGESERQLHLLFDQVRPKCAARKEIFKIHTREWTPKPLDTFLEELAEKCVGYCGADIKALCAEAALCALRRHYPQIYQSREKLQLDVASIEIRAKDFVVAMQKIVPASQRAVASAGRALPPMSKPLLENTLARILEALQEVFPHAELALEKNQQQDTFHDLLRNGAVDSDEESPSIFEDQATHQVPGTQQKKFLRFSSFQNPAGSTKEERRTFFEDVTINQAAKSPVSKSNADRSKRKRRTNKRSSGIAAKRRNFQFNQEKNVPEDQNEAESEEEPSENHVPNTAFTEGGSTQDSSLEENGNVLQAVTAEALLPKMDDMEKVELLCPGFSDTVTLLTCD